jgi:clan AA aspartic protease (TIGR02281 family)
MAPKTRRASVIAFSAIALAGCAAPTQSATSPELISDQQDAEIMKAVTAGLQEIRDKCETRMQDNGLDPIRDKVELMRGIPEDFDNGPPPFSIAANDARPTDQERVAIGKWASIRDECVQQEYQFYLSLPEAWNIPPDRDNVFWITHQEQQKITDLIVALDRSQITYSGFSRKRTEITNQNSSAIDLLQKGQLTPQQALSRAGQLAPVSRFPEVTSRGDDLVSTNSTSDTQTRVEEIKLQKQRDTYVVPVQLNNAVTLQFLIDSGASDVLIPEDVLLTLVRTGTVTEADFIGEQTYSLADGSQLTSTRFNIRELKVGNHIVKNVTASVGPVASDPLLGQSFLSKVKAWTIDNTRHVLVLSEKPQIQQ